MKHDFKIQFSKISIQSSLHRPPVSSLHRQISLPSLCNLNRVSIQNNMACYPPVTATWSRTFRKNIIVLFFPSRTKLYRVRSTCILLQFPKIGIHYTRLQSFSVLLPSWYPHDQRFQSCPSFLREMRS